MLAVGTEGKYTQDVGAGGRGLYQSIKEPSEASRGEFGIEELRLCLFAKLHNQSFSEWPQLD